ncbi:MAG TPA: hypothetical protein PKC24_14530 [Cyclobacteriaceae bacterium]|nr:hypothetical protein [Cyclobacteriaceae bacterium]
MKHVIRVLICISFYLLLTVGAFAQPGGGGGPGAGEPVPIGGIEVLIAMGALLGTRRLFKQRD